MAADGATSDVDIDDRRTELDNRVRAGLAKVGFHGTSEQLVQFYNENVEDYNEMGALVNYQKLGCHALIAALSELVPNKEARILDVAAGTGFAGKELRRFGYSNVDALEPAEKMVDQAKSENIYNNYIIDTVTPDERTDVEDETYDAICIMGSVLKGHVTLECLPELMRIIKKGGVIVFNVAKKYLEGEHADPQFQNGNHVTVFQKYVENGDWLKWDELEAPYRYSENCTIFRIVLA
ncbi:methyltransferase-like protein 27 [Amphiura filiformis]|uniref:methyltransferase-like protein 27 n=1 Tax=Amphiura filiformis TaxID=82378 RepID=UPI003B21F745